MTQDTEPPDRDTPLNTPALSEIEALELFRRSPHPYLRHQNDLRNAQASTESSTTDFSRTNLHPSDQTISDDDGRSRRKTSQSPSESGTEADDEGYGFIKALPAPPLRPHKGLRNIRGSGANGDISPLLTPSQVDEEGRKFSAEYFRPRKGGVSGGEPSPTDEEAKAARQKYLKRRRNELVRRTTETVLLGAITLLAIIGCGCWEKLLQWHKVELLTHALVMGAILILYPLRLLFYSWRKQPPSNLRFRQQIRIPAAFDPAPILYPATLPVIISISLFSTFPEPLLSNVLLGLAALPPQLIPYGNPSLGYSTVHWLISILPLIASEHAEAASRIIPQISPEIDLIPPDHGLQPEILVCLFPLHQALLPPLHYLTTTSLLPAELHLLSIGMVNLLLFTNSPQASILKIVLWLGGVGLFVLCGKVLKWGVALARIPRWRFRRVGQIIKARQSFLQILNDSLKPQRSHSASRAMADSDADEDDYLINKSLKKTKSLKLNVPDSVRNNHLMANGGEVLSAVEAKKTGFEDHQKADLLLSSSKRRNTLPSLPSQPNAPSIRTRRRTKSIAQSYLSLTPTQAAIRKWVYAGYFYLMVVVLILGPVRYVIGQHSLHNHEPFGWAIGYLCGHIQRLRFEIFNWDLGWWIAIPPILDPEDMEWAQQLGFADHLRRVVLGEANVRLLLCAYCVTVIAVGLIVVFRLSSVVEVDTRRKVFHGTMVAMLLPTIYIDPCFVSLALAIVLAIFLLLDLIRASQLPPLSGPIAAFLTPYVDGRDLRGPVVVSHIFLLIGCAIPLWLSLAGVERTGEEPWIGWEVVSRDVSMLAGVVCVGMGDAAASLIGRRYGRRKWPWAGGKSLEGSLAFAVAVTIGLVFGKVWLVLGWGHGLEKSFVEWVTEGIVMVGKAALCAAGASLEEAVLTGGNDNVIVPVVLWVLVRGVRL